MATTQEDRRKAAQARHTQTKEVRPLKTTTIDTAKVNAGLNEGMSLLEATKAAATTVSGDQKSVPAGKGGDQNDAPVKAKKKASGTVDRWKALIASKAFADGKGVITLTDKGRADKPKRNKGTSKFGALDRFRLYKDGMTVDDYCKASKAGGYTLAGAMQDVRWDVAQGLIEVK
jgi:hypothetical protein